MNEHSTPRQPAGDAPQDRNVQNLDYRVAHLRDRLAKGDSAELGVRVEARGPAVLLTGTVPSAQCRDQVLATAEEELAGVPVHSDIVIAETDSPDHAEELA
ncbi:BON domain-containing protein [Streptomyces sp. CRN 30]|uniref:BON domain-containing protein n=1 Tax=Streptomyces sp. CRN 30 TaxID=3075613 RepID=UPI002A7EF08A|nr:BON domain-containing protein [Streptomyces sp. CRN 30]